MVIDPTVVGDNTGLVRIKGDLFVDGTTTQINSTTLEISDFIVGIASTATTDLLTDGAGIKIGPDKTFLYEHNGGTNASLKSSENLNVASGKVYQIGETERLSANTLSVGTGATVHSPSSDTLTLGTGGSEKVRITGIGSVGIGTDNPDGLLEVYNPSASGNTVLKIHNDKTADAANLTLEGKRTSSSGATDTGQLLYKNNGYSVAGIFAHSGDDNDNDNGELSFRTSASGSSSVITERLRITSTGRQQSHAGYAAVGINTFASWARTGGAIRAEIGYNAETTDYMYFGTGTNHPVALRVNNDTALYIKNDAGRSVGIGTDNPAQTLDIMSANPVIRLTDTDPFGVYSQIDGAGGDLILAADGGAGSSNSFISLRVDGTDANAEKLRITSDGKVCIAHDSALHSGNLQVSTSSADAIDINSYSSSADNGGRLSFYRSKNATIGSNTIVEDDDSLGRIDFRGYNTSGNSYNQGATIDYRVDGSVNSSTDMPTAILFKTSEDGSASPTERVRITSDGSVKIGSSNIVEINPSNEYPTIRPTLDLNFAATKVLDDRVTFTRDSIGTYIDENGIS